MISFGLFARSSFLKVNGNKLAQSFVPFAEYAPAHFFSVGVGAPFGFFDGDLLFSDMVTSVKGLLPIKSVKVIPMLSIEIPTGQEGATTDHVELAPAVFIEKMIPNWHLYGAIGGRTSTSSGGGHQEINVFAPHTDKEFWTTVAASYWITSWLGVDGRVGLILEDLETAVPEFQSGLVYQKDIGEKVFKASLSGAYTPRGIRKGGSVSLSASIGF